MAPVKATGVKKKIKAGKEVIQEKMAMSGRLAMTLKELIRAQPQAPVPIRIAAHRFR